jgi:hypothetical protein
MSDPASLNVEMRFRGLEVFEAIRILRSTPAGSRVTFTVSKPAIGGARYAVEVSEMSSANARGVLEDLTNYLEKVSRGDYPPDVAAILAQAGDQR